MGQKITEGQRMPFFRYDTPYSSQNSFRALVGAHAPLILVFFSNFGHPVTRHFVLRYAKSWGGLQSGGLALVVRSDPGKLAANIQPDTLPYPLLCDAAGVLYDYLDIPQKSGALLSCSLDGLKILREAKKQGYRPAKNAPQQMPLTLILDAEGTVLFCHYGTSLTDVPEDCTAMEKLLESLDLNLVAPPDADFDQDFNQAYGQDFAQSDGQNSSQYPGFGPGAAPGQGADADAFSGFEPLEEDFSVAAPLPEDAPAFAAAHGATPPYSGAEPTGEEEADTHEFPARRGAPLGPAKGYPQPLTPTQYDAAALEKTMELGYFNDPYAED
ncbi:MAG: hypothetical protein PHO10_02820 [Gemmiger sp.]|nr:hypothetical protein [Gemmiger sp.]